MARKSFRLEGVEEVEKMFKQLPERIRDRVLLNAVRAGGRVISKEAAALAPKLSGDLARSITVATVKKKKRTNESLVKVGFKKPHSRRAHLTEYGTSSQPAQPFMRPALDSKGPEAIRVITTKLAEGLNKQAIKLGQETGATKKK